ncbi:Hypothetical predicted protein [Scomber scombrus]|uniref:Uncharacterized protein n=1 Tax=Scomber scombrus TaxID=13677 RepID=A0AAV1MYJ9_SCOSC
MNSCAYIDASRGKKHHVLTSVRHLDPGGGGGGGGAHCYSVVPRQTGERTHRSPISTLTESINQSIRRDRRVSTQMTSRE